MVPGDDYVVSGGYNVTINDWPNDEGRLEFTTNLEPEWVSESRYAFAGELVAADGEVHPITGIVRAGGRTIFVPAPDAELLPASTPSPFYTMFGQVPSLNIAFCAEWFSRRRSWSGPAWVTPVGETSNQVCRDQFFIRLDPLPEGT
jgi:hypothetical protein